MKIDELILARNKPFYSLEFFPPKVSGTGEEAWSDFFRTVQKLMALEPLFASVTYGAGGSSQHSTLDLVRRIKKEYGLESMAHLTCVGATDQKLSSFLGELVDNNIHNILALRGDIPPGQEEAVAQSQFAHASDLVRFAKSKFPSLGIGVAGYPAPHPESNSFSSDWRYTVAKIREGASFVITQLFFDVREYFHFVDRLNDMGVSIPVVPGILPIENLESLKRTLSLCGANIPGKLYLDLEKAHQNGGSAQVKEAGIAFAVEQIKTLLAGGAPGVHLYTLNRASTCLRILEEVGPLSA